MNDDAGFLMPVSNGQQKPEPEACFIEYPRHRQVGKPVLRLYS